MKDCLTYQMIKKVTVHMHVCVHICVYVCMCEVIVRADKGLTHNKKFS